MKRVDKLWDRIGKIRKRNFFFWGGQGTAPHSGKKVNCGGIYIQGSPSWTKEVKSQPFDLIVWRHV